MNGVAEERSRLASGFTQLMQWADRANRSELPAQIRRRAALVLADDLAAMVMASSEPEVSATMAQLASASCAPEAHVFKKGAKLIDRYSAAASNGMAITWCELDEGFRRAPSHGGAYALPAIVAEAEFRRASVADVLRALAIAYEITARIALTFKFDVMTVHPHAGLANIGAAAGAALVRRFNAGLLEATISSACAMTFAGPFNHAVEGALVRNAWTSAGAWIGMRCADWAEAGISGLAETPFDVFTTIFGAHCHPGEMTANLGDDWAVSNGYHKMFACCQYAHSAVEANLELTSRLQQSARSIDDISEIVVETHKLGMALTNAAPETTLAAKFSLPHAMAATAVLRTGGFDAFTAATLSEPAIAGLRPRVRLALHPAIKPWPNDRPARVTWRFPDGEAWQASCESAKGGADNPYDEAAIMKKICKATAADFPRMVPVLQRLLTTDAATQPGSWRAVVDEMLNGAHDVRH